MCFCIAGAAFGSRKTTEGRRRAAAIGAAPQRAEFWPPTSTRDSPHLLAYRLGSTFRALNAPVSTPNARFASVLGTSPQNTFCFHPFVQAEKNTARSNNFSAWAAGAPRRARPPRQLRSRRDPSQSSPRPPPSPRPRLHPPRPLGSKVPRTNSVHRGTLVNREKVPAFVLAPILSLDLALFGGE
jgi:hypothetical protein